MDELAWADLEPYIRFDDGLSAFVWKARNPEMFKQDGGKTPDHLCRAWNARFAGKIVFKTANGPYRFARFLGKKEYLHRVCYAFYYGSVPKGAMVRHKNGNTADNAMSNLELSEHLKNARRNARRINNTSGVMGVRWEPQRRLWRVEIGVNGKNRFVGRFASFPEAVDARKNAEATHGFHERHGEEKIVINAPLLRDLRPA